MLEEFGRMSLENGRDEDIIRMARAVIESLDAQARWPPQPSPSLRTLCLRKGCSCPRFLHKDLMLADAVAELLARPDKEPIRSPKGAACMHAP